MHEVVRPSGLKIFLPDACRIGTFKPEAKRRRLAAREESVSAEPLVEHAVIAEAMTKQEMMVVDSFELELASPPQARLRSREAYAKSGIQSVPLSLDVQLGEDAVMLVEQDGVHQWIFPTVRMDVAANFDLATSRRQRLDFNLVGRIADSILSCVNVLVLKFAARSVVNVTTKILEHNVERGLVAIGLEGATCWQRIGDMRALPLPTDRPAKILLFVHGTFSSTAGSFGTLGITSLGQSFLKNALSSYDAVLGFDHPTLSEDPGENAVDLLARLQRGPWSKHAPKVDAIAFSRGALVLRSLIEQLLPASGWTAQFQRAVFVGGTNGGTALAEPDNWHALINLHTNLAIRTGRRLELTQAGSLSDILVGAMQGIGALVKWMATEAVSSGNRVPGLAAMEPDGTFIATLNSQRSVAMTDKASDYYAVVSQFEPNASDGQDVPIAFPLQSGLRLFDGFVDRLMKNRANDLVVDTASMTKFSPGTQEFLRDACDLGTTSQVHHLNYFVQPKVIMALTRWLMPEAPLPKSPDRSARRKNLQRRGRGHFSG